MDSEAHKPKAMEVSEANFKQEVLDWPTPVLVAFMAPWSQACRTVTPVFEELLERCSGKLKTARVNADENPNLGVLYDIQYIPALVLFSGGRVRMHLHGTATADAIMAKVESILKSC